LRRVADEDDLTRRRRVEERARALACVLEALGRALGELVHTAMDVRVRRLVETVHRLEHLAWLLRARGRIEEGERLSVERLLEDREIRAQRARVKLRSGLYGHITMVNVSPIRPSTAQGTLSLALAALAVLAAGCGGAATKPPAQRTHPTLK